MTRFYLDTEFLESGPQRPIELISLALVTDDGPDLYLVNADFDRSHASDWLAEHVLPHLDRADAPEPVPYAEFGPRVEAFVAGACQGSKPAFWMWSGAYDFVLLNGCFGRMIDTPHGWPKHFHDLRAWAGQLGNISVPRTQPHEHDALFDARHDRDAFWALSAVAAARTLRVERRLRQQIANDIATPSASAHVQVPLQVPDHGRTYFDLIRKMPTAPKILKVIDEPDRPGSPKAVPHRAVSSWATSAARHLATTGARTYFDVLREMTTDSQILKVVDQMERAESSSKHHKT